MPDQTNWQQIIAQEIRRRNKKMSLADLADLRQDLYLACLESRAGTDKEVERLCRERLSGKRTDEPESLGDPKFRGLLSSDATNDRTRLVREAILMLPENEQFVIRGLFYENQTVSELAQALGQSVSWVQRTKRLSMSKIENHIKKELTNAS